MVLRVSLLLTAITLSYYSFSQSIEKIRIEPQGAKVLVTYDLNSDNPNDRYNVRIYGSHDDFRQPLLIVRGDVGDNISPGTNKLIEWYAREELGAFSGSLSIEIRLFESRTAFYIQSPYAKSSSKRGKGLLINWSGGDIDDNVQIDLYRQGAKLSTIANSAENSGNFDWTVPKSMKPSSQYQVRIQSINNPNVQAFSGHFSIRPKLGLGIKIGPAAIVAGLVGCLVGGCFDDPGPQDLPSPPEPN